MKRDTAACTTCGTIYWVAKGCPACRRRSRFLAWLPRSRASRVAAEVAFCRELLAAAHARLADYDRAWAAMAVLPAAVGESRPARADRIAASGLTLIPGGAS